MVDRLFSSAPTEELLNYAQNLILNNLHDMRVKNDWIDFANRHFEHAGNRLNRPAFNPSRPDNYPYIQVGGVSLKSDIIEGQSEMAPVMMFDEYGMVSKISGYIADTSFGKIYRGKLVMPTNVPGIYEKTSDVALKFSSLQCSRNGTRKGTNIKVFEDAERELAVLTLLSPFHHNFILPLMMHGYSDKDELIFVTPLGKYSLSFKLKEFSYEIDNDFVMKFKTQIGSALSCLHALGFAHRDIGLENILEMWDQTLKLIDFGLCTGLTLKDTTSGVWLPLQFERSSGGELLAVGKEKYFPPEFFLAQHHLGYDAQKADVFAFGMSIYVLVLNQFPYEQNMQSIRSFWTKPERLEIIWNTNRSPHHDSIDEFIWNLLDIDPIRRWSIHRLMYG
jgi:serine/threonine protein kinase